MSKLYGYKLGGGKAGLMKWLCVAIYIYNLAQGILCGILLKVDTRSGLWLVTIGFSYCNIITHFLRGNL